MAPADGPVALLGGSGFIGSRLADLLERDGIEFRIFDIRNSLTGRSTRITDVTDLESLRANLEDGGTWVNLAAVHRDDVRPRSLYREVNVEGARNVCQAARDKGVRRIVFTSSVAVYGLPNGEPDESGAFNPFNDYGKTKAEAEGIYRAWQDEDRENRCLVIVRPTVVFGEGNRGNVYNLLRQLHSGRFLMVGSGKNRKSMAYVGNMAAFLQHCLGFGPGVHVYNYIDKPDLDMNCLVATVRQKLGRPGTFPIRLPYLAGYAGGWCLDAIARLTGKTFPISAVRVKKFCADTAFATSILQTGFTPPYTLQEGLERTIRYEFLEQHEGPVFYTE